jgi:hypothetical protein
MAAACPTLPGCQQQQAAHLRQAAYTYINRGDTADERACRPAAWLIASSRPHRPIHGPGVAAVLLVVALHPAAALQGKPWQPPGSAYLHAQPCPRAQASRREHTCMHAGYRLPAVTGPTIQATSPLKRQAANVRSVCAPRARSQNIPASPVHGTDMCVACSVWTTARDTASCSLCSRALPASRTPPAGS